MRSDRSKVRHDCVCLFGTFHLCVTLVYNLQWQHERQHHTHEGNSPFCSPTGTVSVQLSLYIARSIAESNCMESSVFRVCGACRRLLYRCTDFVVLKLGESVNCVKSPTEEVIRALACGPESVQRLGGEAMQPCKLGGPSCSLALSFMILFPLSDLVTDLLPLPFG